MYDPHLVYPTVRDNYRSENPRDSFSCSSTLHEDSHGMHAQVALEAACALTPTGLSNKALKASLQRRWLHLWYEVKETSRTLRSPL